MPPQHPRKLFIVNAFGALGYLSCLFQWLWAVIIFLPTFMDSDAGKWVLPQENQQAAPHLTIEEPPLLLTIIVIAITALVLVVTAIVLARLPAQIARAGKKITHTPAEALVPIVTHHQPISVKKQRQISGQIIRILKLLLCVLPFLVATLAFLIDIAIPYEAIIIIAAAMAGFSLLWFGLQYLCARLWRLADDKVA